MRLRKISLYSVILVVCAAALSATWYSSHAFNNRLLKQEAISEAIRWANFIVARSPDLTAELRQGRISTQTRDTLELASQAGGVFRFKLFGPDGVIVHASRPGDLGQRTTKPYFNELVRNRQTFAKIATGEDFGADRSVVSEAYVPIMEGGRFQGAVEVYVDETIKAASFDQAAHFAFWGAVVLVIGMAISWAFFIWRDLIGRDRALAELHEREGELTDQNERFNAALENMSQGLCMFDGEQRLIVANARYASMYGLSPELVKPGTPFRQILEHRIASDIFAGQVHEDYIQERLSAVLERNPSTKIQELSDGRFVAISHCPMSNGGWLATHEDITEQKRAEAALQESGKQFRNLVEGSIQGVYIHMDWKLLFANPALADIFGYDSPEEMLALGNIGRLLSPDEHERLWGYKNARQKGEFAPDVYEARGVKKDGSGIWAEFRITPVDWHGAPAMQCVVVDITERRRAEEKLQNQNECFNAALENMSQGLCMFDGEQRLIVGNARYASMYGLSLELVKPGTPFRQILEHRIAGDVFAGQVHEDYIQERLSAVLERNPSTKIQELSDGRFVEISHCPMPGGGWLATHEDITERKKVEKSQMESDARLRAVFDNSPFCLNLKDTGGRYLFANKRYEEWWGHSVEDVIGKTAGEFQSDPDGVHNMTASENLVLETGDTDENEISIKRPRDGEMRDRLLIKFPVKSPDGSIMGLGTFAVDITERKKAEAELARHRDHLQELVEAATKELKNKADELTLALAKEQELNKLQREFVSMASHEFRTPLAIIDATAQRMKSRADKNRLTPEDAGQRVEKIRAAVKRMTQLMESTLTAARMQEGKIKVEIKPCDIGKVVREVCARQQEISQAHVISCDLAGLPDTIQADEGALERIITNLLSNAVKYAPDSPDIEIRARTEGDQVAISVRDHGLGIDADELERIGERFFRARTSTGTAGTGIGLNLAKTLTEMHGGTIDVESETGEGSTFTIRLPIAGPDRTQQADTRAA